MFRTKGIDHSAGVNSALPYRANLLGALEDSDHEAGGEMAIANELDDLQVGFNQK